MKKFHDAQRQRLIEGKPVDRPPVIIEADKRMVTQLKEIKQKLERKKEKLRYLKQNPII